MYTVEFEFEDYIYSRFRTVASNNGTTPEELLSTLVKNYVINYLINEGHCEKALDTLCPKAADLSSSISYKSTNIEAQRDLRVEVYRLKPTEKQQEL